MALIVVRISIMGDGILFVFMALLPVVAFFYAAVGHGGASGYLALMALFGFLPETMKPTALLLNLFVAGVSFYHYHKQGHFNWKLFWPFALASVPLAFWGGKLEVEEGVYKKILAVLLVFAVLKMLNVFGKEGESRRQIHVFLGVVIGGGIGFFSGLIGIGGGIILSPVVLLLRWGSMKEAAAVSALFIWVNSAAGMGGLLSKGEVLTWNTLGYAVIAALGGYFGARWGSGQISNRGLRYLLVGVLGFACLKLLFA